MEFSKGTLSTLRNWNRANILEVIKQYSPTSRAKIAKTLSMSRSVVSEIVEQLISEGLVEEIGIGKSTPAGGRRPVQLRFVSDAKFALGVDIGSTKTIAVLTNLSGGLVAHTKFRTPHDGVNPLYHVAKNIEQFLVESGVPTDKILGAGIGVPSIANYETGELIHAPGLGLENVNIREFFSGRLPGKILVDNDSNMGVLGERWKGNGKGYSTVILLAIGTGIGAGLIIDGKLFRGANGYAGEIGYLPVDPLKENPAVDIAHFGPFEQIASGRGIENQVMKYFDRFPDSVLDLSNISAKDVFEAAAQGDRLATFVIETTVQYIAGAIAGIVVLLNPGVVIVGGGVGQAGDKFLADIKRRVRQLVPIPFHLVRAGLGEQANAYGGAATVLLESGNLKSL